MPKFTLVCDHSCDLDTHVVTHQFDAEHLYDVLDNIDLFLRGSGYAYDGTVTIEEQHSQHYYNKDRNR